MVQCGYGAVRLAGQMADKEPLVWIFHSPDKPHVLGSGLSGVIVGGAGWPILWLVMAE